MEEVVSVRGVGGEKTWELLVYGMARRAGMNYLPLARGSPAERQTLTFGKGAIVYIQRSVMSGWDK